MSKPPPPPVEDTNPPRPLRVGRAPRPAEPADEATPAAQVPQQPEQASTPEPAAPPVAPVPQPTTPAPAGTTLAHQGDEQFAPYPGGHLLSGDSVSVLSGLHKLRRKPINPMTDYASDSTRVPRFIKMAAVQVNALTGRNMQEIYRDAILGIAPLPDDVIAAALVELYGPHMQDWRPGDPLPQ
ncbi:hypothetical protein [Micromonospora sp. NPDC049645]|uniref:hypothetical protein n=1 Tax=Micromonospora sp. NPDC049645 TaxID=3155508 RepID=UPI0034151F95